MNDTDTVTWTQFILECKDLTVIQVSQICHAPIGALHKWMTENSVPRNAFEAIQKFWVLTNELE